MGFDRRPCTGAIIPQILAVENEMTISDMDCKLLWARAAGICSNPGCRQDLTVILEGPASYNIGEMAHIIAKRPGGPRGRIGIDGLNTYHNLILLCPTCHTRADKAPQEYPEELLKSWKADHERQIRDRGAEVRFKSAALLKNSISRVSLRTTRYGQRSAPALTLRFQIRARICIPFGTSGNSTGYFQTTTG
jgi:hypothetical protein